MASIKSGLTLVTGQILRLLLAEGFCPVHADIGTCLHVEFADAAEAERCAAWLRGAGPPVEAVPGDDLVGPSLLVGIS